MILSIMTLEQRREEILLRLEIVTAKMRLKWAIACEAGSDPTTPALTRVHQGFPVRMPRYQSAKLAKLRQKPGKQSALIKSLLDSNGPAVRDGMQRVWFREMCQCRNRRTLQNDRPNDPIAVRCDGREERASPVRGDRLFPRTCRRRGAWRWARPATCRPSRSEGCQPLTVRAFSALDWCYRNRVVQGL